MPDLDSHLVPATARAHWVSAPQHDLPRMTRADRLAGHLHQLTTRHERATA